MGRSRTVPWVGESNPGLGLQPPQPEEHLFLLKRSGHLSSQDWERQLSGPSQSLVVGIPSCLKSLWSSKKKKKSFLPGISFPVSKQPTLLAEMSFLLNLPPGGWECSQPSGRVPEAHAAWDGECAPSSEAQNSQSSTSSSSRFVTRPKIAL